MQKSSNITADARRVSRILSDALDDGSVVFFVGAGISFNSGIPTVQKIVQSTLEFFGATPDEISKYENSNIPFEAFVDSISSFIEPRKILSSIGNSYCSPNVNHKYLINTLINNKSVSIVTTNFDQMLEKALMDTKLAHRVSVHSDISKCREVPVSSIVKIHGCISNEKTILSSIKRIANRKSYGSVNRIISNIVNRDDVKYICVLGYSCSDIFDIVPSFARNARLETNVIFIEHAGSGDKFRDRHKYKKFRSTFGEFNHVYAIIDTNELISIMNNKNEQSISKSIKLNGIITNDLKNSDDFSRKMALVRIFMQSADYKSAEKYLKLAAIGAEKNRDERKVAQVYSAFGDLYTRIKDSSVPIGYYTKSLYHSKRSKMPPKEISSVMGSLAYAYLRNREFSKAKENLLKCEKYNLKNHISNEYIYAYWGAFYKEMEEFKEAIRYTRRAISLCDNGDVFQLSKYYSQLAIFYSGIKKFQYAQRYFQKAYDLSEKLEVPEYAEAYLCGLGEVCKYRGKFEESIGYFRKSLNICKRIGKQKAMGISMGNIGDAYFGMKQYDKAKYWYMKNIKQTLVSSDISGRFAASLGILRVYMARNQSARAISYLKQLHRWAPVNDLSNFRELKDLESQLMNR